MSRQEFYEKMLTGGVVDDILATVPKAHKMLGVSYVAEKLGVSRQTVRNYIEAGKIDAIKLPDSSYKVTSEELRRFLNMNRVFNLD